MLDRLKIKDFIKSKFKVFVINNINLNRQGCLFVTSR